MVFNKAGDCLGYGLGYELIKKKDDKTEKPNYNLRSSTNKSKY